MGSLLEARGVVCDPPLWSANAMLDQPEQVAAIHREYAEAGAELLTTNTFRTRARSLAAAGSREDASELTRHAVAIARDAADAHRIANRPTVWVAGSIAPLEDCYEPGRAPDDASLAREHRDLAKVLQEAGCDLLLVETHNTIREAQAATRAAYQTGLPVWSCVVCGGGARLLSGEPLAAAVAALAAAGASAVGVNCSALEHCVEALPVLLKSGVPFGVAPNLHFDPSQTTTPDRTTSPMQFVDATRPWLEAGATFVGACCGSEPRHIAALRAAISPNH